jgi:serine/threonine-protein kinase
VDGVARLFDFGSVRITVRAREVHVRASGEILGTPLYLSPEQATGGRELHERSAIYSLGAVA